MEYLGFILVAGTMALIGMVGAINEVEYRKPLPAQLEQSIQWSK